LCARWAATICSEYRQRRSATACVCRQSCRSCWLKRSSPTAWIPSAVATFRCSRSAVHFLNSGKTSPLPAASNASRRYGQHPEQLLHERDGAPAPGALRAAHQAAHLQRLPLPGDRRGRCRARSGSPPLGREAQRERATPRTAARAGDQSASRRDLIVDEPLVVLAEPFDVAHRVGREQPAADQVLTELAHRRAVPVLRRPLHLERVELGGDRHRRELRRAELVPSG
jgi:hypothetical protein